MDDKKNNDDGLYEKELHELFLALHNTLKTANQQMKNSNEGLSYNIDEVEFELPIEIGFSDWNDGKDSPGNLPKPGNVQVDKKSGGSSPSALKVSLGKQSAKGANATRYSLRDLIEEKKLMAERGRVRVKFSREMMEEK